MLRIASRAFLLAAFGFFLWTAPSVRAQQHAHTGAPRPPAASAALPGALLADLLSAKPEVQNAALDKLDHLDKLSTQRLVPRLIKELDSPDFDRYFGAILALGKIGPPALAALLKVMQGQGDARRRYAAMAIGRMGTSAASAVPVFVTCLSDSDTNLRLIVADELPKLGPSAKAGVPTLIALTRDENVFLRLAAVKALGRIGPGAESAIPFLVDALKEGTYGADFALGAIGAPAVPAVLAVFKSAPDKELRERAMSALGEMGPQGAPAVPDLVAALKSNDSRGSAIGALGGIGPGAKDAVPPLIAILQGSAEYSNAPPPGYEYTIDAKSKTNFVEKILGTFDQTAARMALQRIATPEALAAVKEYDDKQEKEKQDKGK